MHICHSELFGDAISPGALEKSPIMANTHAEAAAALCAIKIMSILLWYSLISLAASIHHQ